MSREEFWGKTELWDFLFFRTFSGKLVAFRWNFWLSCQNRNLCVKSSFLMKISSFWKKIMIFSINFRTWAKNFGPFVQKISAGLSKQSFTCPFKQIEEKKFNEKNFPIFQTFSDNIETFCRKFFGWVFKTASYVSRGKLRRKHIFFYFRTLRDKMPAFRRLRSAGLSKLHSRCL